MKSRLCLLLSAAILITAVPSGCGGQSGGAVPQNSEDPASQTIANINENELSTEASKNDKPSTEASESDEPSPEASENDEPSPEASENDEPSPEASENDEPSPEASENDEPSPEASENDEPPEAQAVTLNKHEIYLYPGEQSEIRYYLTPDNAAPPGVVYYISDTSVYTVDPYGTITAVGEGTAKLTAEAKNGLRDVCTITVKARPTQDSSQEPDPIPENSDDYEKPDRIVDAFRPYTSDRVYKDINSLCDYYVNILSQFNIGESEKGKPIPCVTLGKGKKKALIVAGIHSREHISISFTMRCIEEIADAYSASGTYCGYDVRSLLEQYTLYIVPMCNPDGTDIAVAGDQPLADLGRFNHDSCKFNANGVNLNRNYPYCWEQTFGNTKLRPGDETYPGTHAGSEKETQALMKLCSENEFLWLLDMHILGGGIYWSDEGNGTINGDYLLASSIASRCGFRLFPTTMGMSNYSGGLENWFRSTYKRPGLCIELIPSSQAYYTNLYSGYNSYFEQAVNWQQTRCTFLEAMSCMK